LGTIIHETLKSLYDPFVGVYFRIRYSKLLQIDDEVLKQFKVVYKEGEIKKGRKLAEVARNVSNFLKVEMESIKAAMQ
jgi:hypothetical protein